MVKRRFSNFQKLTKINVFNQLQDISHVKSLKSTKTCLKNGCLCSNKVMKNPTPLAPSVPYMGRLFTMSQFQNDTRYQKFEKQHFRLYNKVKVLFLHIYKIVSLLPWAVICYR